MVGIYLFGNPDDPARRPFTRGEIGAFLSMFWRNNGKCVRRVYATLLYAARLRDLNGYGMKEVCVDCRPL